MVNAIVSWIEIYLPVSCLHEFALFDAFEHGPSGVDHLHGLTDATCGGGQRVGREEGLNFGPTSVRAEAVGGVDDGSVHEGRGCLGEHSLDVREVVLVVLPGHGATLFGRRRHRSDGVEAVLHLHVARLHRPVQRSQFQVRQTRSTQRVHRISLYKWVGGIFKENFKEIS